MSGQVPFKPECLPQMHKAGNGVPGNTNNWGGLSHLFLPMLLTVLANHLLRKWWRRGKEKRGQPIFPLPLASSFLTESKGECWWDVVEIQNSGVSCGQESHPSGKKKYIWAYDVWNINCVSSVIPRRREIIFFNLKWALHSISIRGKIHVNNLKCFFSLASEAQCWALTHAPRGCWLHSLSWHTPSGKLKPQWGSCRSQPIDV